MCFVCFLLFFWGWFSVNQRRFDSDYVIDFMMKQIE
ncbi:hypothetical protein FLACOL_00483 [Flavobacterium columnare]|uniref:Uncharacterized protein n=1 Tax=Flavobacterium columnare TaxID=996 RepID=A0A2N9P831_9FLAO|nr:hypothetical protein FLACOL_00483 [Flavobacterium columnare]